MPRSLHNGTILKRSTYGIYRDKSACLKDGHISRISEHTCAQVAAQANTPRPPAVDPDPVC